MRSGSYHEATIRPQQPQPGRWDSVAEVTRMFGMAPMTVYRVIHARVFPAVKIRGGYVVPAKALDAMAAAAVTTQGLVAAADWVATGGAR